MRRHTERAGEISHRPAHDRLDSGRPGPGPSPDAVFSGGHAPAPQAPRLVQPPAAHPATPGGTHETAGSLRGSPDRSKLRSQARSASRKPRPETGAPCPRLGPGVSPGPGGYGGRPPGGPGRPCTPARGFRAGPGSPCARKLAAPRGRPGPGTAGCRDRAPSPPPCAPAPGSGGLLRSPSQPGPLRSWTPAPPSGPSARGAAARLAGCRWPPASGTGARGHVRSSQLTGCCRHPGLGAPAVTTSPMTPHAAGRSLFSVNFSGREDFYTL
jgi:hypothetical protein